MAEFIEIHWTSASMDEARKVCRYLVQERLIACAEIIPWMESVYIWNNQLETVQESKIHLKTSLDKYNQIKEYIEKNCAYQIPQIIYTKIDGGNPEYLKWLEDACCSISHH